MILRQYYRVTRHKMTDLFGTAEYTKNQIFPSSNTSSIYHDIEVCNYMKLLCDSARGIMTLTLTNIVIPILTSSSMILHFIKPFPSKGDVWWNAIPLKCQYWLHKHSILKEVWLAYHSTWLLKYLQMIVHLHIKKQMSTVIH